ncbi:MAG: TIM barrel protein [Planctomycetota bacterium]|nr:TIM barrel protein [Planctomycetota bacterium]
MNTSIASYSFHSLVSAGMMDVFGYLEACKYRYHIDTADIWNGLMGRDPAVYLKEDFLKKVKDALADRGLTLVNYHADGCHFWEPDAAVRQKHHQLALAHVKAAEFLGAKTVRIDTGGHDPVWSPEQFDVVVSRSREFARRAADGGYRFGPEVHWGTELDPANLERLALAVDNPGFGLLLHLGRYKNATALEGDQRLAKWAMHTHVDSATIRDRLDPTLELLAKSGYQGSLSVEDGSGTHEYATVAVMLEQVRAGLARLRQRVEKDRVHPENPLLAPGTQK